MERIKHLTVTMEDGTVMEFSGLGQFHDVHTVVPGDTKKDDKPCHYVYVALTPDPTR